MNSTPNFLAEPTFYCGSCGALEVFGPECPSCGRLALTDLDRPLPACQQCGHAYDGGSCPLCNPEPDEGTPTITVYTRPDCVQCTAVTRRLTWAGATWTELPLAEHPEVLAEARARGLTAAPVVVAGDRWSGGYTPDAIDRAITWSEWGF